MNLITILGVLVAGYYYYRYKKDKTDSTALSLSIGAMSVTLVAIFVGMFSDPKAELIAEQKQKYFQQAVYSHFAESFMGNLTKAQSEGDFLIFHDNSMKESERALLTDETLAADNRKIHWVNIAEYLSWELFCRDVNKRIERNNSIQTLIFFADFNTRDLGIEEGQDLELPIFLQEKGSFSLALLKGEGLLSQMPHEFNFVMQKAGQPDFSEAYNIDNYCRVVSNQESLSVVEVETVGKIK